MVEAIGIDVGGTRVKAVRVNQTGEVLERFNSPSSALNTPHYVQQALTQFTQPTPLIGLCSPGLVAPDGLSIAHVAGKLEVVGVNWSQVLSCPNPVPVLNDAHAALLGEAWLGGAAGKSDVVLLTLGTGVGGAVLWGGKLVTGRRGLAGSVGHISLDPNGPLSIYNTPGSLEFKVGDASVLLRSGGRFSDTRGLVEAHLAGDGEASQIWLRSLRDLAAAIASLINLFDPECVLLAGGITAAGRTLTEPLEGYLEHWEYRPGNTRVPIVLATLGEYAGAIGAARQALSTPVVW